MWQRRLAAGAICQPGETWQQQVDTWHPEKTWQVEGESLFTENEHPKGTWYLLMEMCYPGDTWCLLIETQRRPGKVTFRTHAWGVST